MVSVPTITIKKIDGSVVRMSLAEFEEYKKVNSLPQDQADGNPVIKEEPKSDSANQLILTKKQNLRKSKYKDEENEPKLQEVSKKRVENQTSVVNDERKIDFTSKKEDKEIVVEGRHELATTTPVKAIFISEAKAKVWDQEDHKSLLEENIPKSAASSPSLPDKHEDLLDLIIKELKLVLDPELKVRLHSIILSKIKDIRSDEQVIDYLVKGQKNGGMGLNTDQANMVIGLVAAYLKNKAEKIKKHFTQENAQIKPLAVFKTTSNPPSLQNIRGNFSVLKKIEKTEKEKIIAPNDEVADYMQKGGVVLNNIKNIQDIEAPKHDSSVTMGPIDEIRVFNLVDFRRLDNDPEKAGKILYDKFNTLKKDSYLLYMDAKEAWKESSLFLEYQKNIINSLNQNVQISEYLKHSETGKMSFGEFQALLKLNKKLDN